MCVQDVESDGGEGGGEMGEGGEEGDTTLYCMCRRVSYGEMIACDNTECPIEWFHLGCVGLTSTNRPRGKWFCPDCRFYESQEDAEGDHRRLSPNPPRKRTLPVEVVVVVVVVLWVLPRLCSSALSMPSLPSLTRQCTHSRSLTLDVSVLFGKP